MRAWVYFCAHFRSAAVLGDQLSELVRLMTTNNRFANAVFRAKKTGRHVIVSGDLTVKGLYDFLTGFPPAARLNAKISIPSTACTGNAVDSAVHARAMRFFGTDLVYGAMHML